MKQAVKACKFSFSFCLKQSVEGLKGINIFGKLCFYLEWSTKFNYSHFAWLQSVRKGINRVCSSIIWISCFNFEKTVNPIQSFSLYPVTVQEWRLEGFWGNVFEFSTYPSEEVNQVDYFHKAWSLSVREGLKGILLVQQLR